MWIQGGAVDDPVLDRQYPGAYGFGALRCAIDDLNGDNVDTVQWPAGVRHVFCYAYYVNPPPSSGTIIVRKVLQGAPDATESFVVAGNVSYDPSGTFTLTPQGAQPAAQTFFRAAVSPGQEPWTIQEEPSDGWIATGLSCTQGASAVSIDRATRRAEIVLAAGDTVTCTYTNAPRPTAGALILRKITDTDIGRFGFETSTLGGVVTDRRTIATTVAGVAAPSRPIKLAPGRYRVREVTPGAGDRRWRLRGIVCNGRRSTGVVEIAAARGSICTFTNERRYIGRIAVRKVTQGGTGTAGFTIAPLGGTPAVYRKTATTRRQDTAAAATGDATVGLPFGRYVIRETEAVSAQKGRWGLLRVTCDGRLVPFAQGRALVRITAEDPRTTCTFTNRLTLGARPQPVEPAPPTAPLPPGPPVITPGTPGPLIRGFPAGTPGAAQPNLTITKRAGAAATRVGSVVTYRIEVSNAGTAIAREVVLGEQPGPGAQFVGAEATGGTCGDRLPLVCRLGSLAAGDSRTVVVRLRATSSGPLDNVAAVGSASADAQLTDNVARAALLVREDAGRPCASTAEASRPGAACRERRPPTG